MPTIIAFPKSGFIYNDFLSAAMERNGERVEQGVFAMRWLVKHSRRGDVMHLHWPSFFYYQPTRLASIKDFVRWMLILAVARLRGVRIFWSAHNVLPHDRSPIPILDIWGRNFLIALSSRIFVHGHHAGKKLIERFPKVAHKLAYVPHGHWISAYPAEVGRTEARRSLGISDGQRAFLFIGLCKPYKNLEALLEAFATLTGDIVLHIAGKFPDPDYKRRVMGLAARDPRVVIHDGFVPHEAMATYLQASDVVVAPYRETLTSGAAMLAMSFGRPIVSIATGHLLDVVTDETGVLYEPSIDGALAEALDVARRRTFDEAGILDHARRFTYEEAAVLTSRAYRENSSR